MPLIHSGSGKAVSKNIEEMVKAGHPQKQAVAAALNNQREFARKKGVGGPLPYPDREGSTAPTSRDRADPKMEYHPLYADPGTHPSARHASFKGKPVVGLIKSPVAGRTDRLPIHVYEDSYVVPADVVSGWGQGNTDAGAKLLDSILGGHMQVGQGHFAKGGMAGGGLRQIPIIAAGGEYVVHPAAVASMGGGNLRKGHEILDKMVKNKRMRTARHMQRLPGPKRD